MVKKVISAVLAMALLLSMAGCSLFSDDSIVKLGEDYTHKDPKDLSYDQRIVLRGENFQDVIESMANVWAYPDTMVYDDDGNVIGMYDYDEETGLAAGWTSMEDGTYTAFPDGEEVDLGKPDSSKMIEIPGEVTLYFVVYGNEGSTESAYVYAMLSDASAKDLVTSNLETYYDLTLSAESDTVLTCVQDQAAIDATFDEMESYGIATGTRDAEAYADILKQTYGVKSYGGVNAYQPYADHKEPEGLEYDQKVVLTGNGAAAVEEQYADDISSMTTFVYGNKGEVVADYTYFECTSKEAADELMDVVANATRVSDTVLEQVTTGDDMTNTVNAYIGYNVLKDNSVDEYVRMIEETYFSEIYE